MRQLFFQQVIMKIELLNIDRVAELLHLSKPNIYLKIQLRRQGKLDFPLPITSHKQRHLWLADEVERYILRRNAQNNPPSLQDKQIRKHQSAETLATLEKFGLGIPQ